MDCRGVNANTQSFSCWPTAPLRSAISQSLLHLHLAQRLCWTADRSSQANVEQVFVWLPDAESSAGSEPRSAPATEGLTAARGPDAALQTASKSHEDSVSLWDVTDGQAPYTGGVSANVCLKWEMHSGGMPPC
ncbi:hypothetical protein AAFF_G00087260 [Aldrovandia affinis]|uniref:Uncharacterized protein n=1 Tax=Aldrovandia affinis TaxID=143900 RepID=A0AAD7RWL7_9TELE|nr:hypothetical protein AAFF_G00087260 [Aldrovandia affinis]